MPGRHFSLGADNFSVFKPGGFYLINGAIQKNSGLLYWYSSQEMNTSIELSDTKQTEHYLSEDQKALFLQKNIKKKTEHNVTMLE